MGWKQDRIYVFLMAGLIRNNDVQRKFFYDRESKLFFELKLSDKNIYTLPDKYYNSKNYYPADKYASRIKLLESLLDKVKNKSTDIFEFIKFENIEQNADFQKPIKIVADWQKIPGAELENRKFNAVQGLLDRNNIDPETSDVLE